MKEEEFFSNQVFRSRIFRRDLGEASSRPLSLVCGGCEHCSSDYRIDRRDFPYWCLEFVVSGRGSVAIAGGPQRSLEPGAIFIYGPGIAYRMESDPSQPFVKYFADFTGRRARSLLRESGLVAGTVAQVFPARAVAEAFDQMIDVGLEDTPRASLRASLLLEALLLGCADRRIPDGASESRAFATYRRCRDLIDALDPAGQEIHSIAATARACHIDSAYLCRLFRRFARLTPYQYLMRRRMEAAMARLSQSGRLVKEVAEEFGFADPYHFSRAFKSFHGIAPSRALRARMDL